MGSKTGGGDVDQRPRGSWPVRAYPLGQEPPDDIASETTPQERLAMMWPLALEAWRLSGRPIPDYDRAHVPARLIRPGDPRPDDDEPR